IVPADNIPQMVMRVHSTHAASLLLLGLAGGDPGQDEGEQDDHAVDEVEPLAGYLGQGQHVLYQVQQQDAGERAEDGPLAAVEAHAADDRGGEHREDLARALGGGDGGEPAGVEQPAEGGQQAADDQYGPDHPVDADAGGAGGVGAAADGVPGAADAGVAHDDDGDRVQGQADPDRRRDAQPHRVAQVQEG